MRSRVSFDLYGERQKIGHREANSEMTHLITNVLPMGILRDSIDLPHTTIHKNSIIFHVQIVYGAIICPGIYDFQQCAFLLLAFCPIWIERLGVFTPTDVWIKSFPVIAC
jgi:hypothetical protein